MSEQRFPGRIWITNPDTDFLRMQNLGPQHEWLHLTEHQHLMAEKDKRIERLREALKKIEHYQHGIPGTYSDPIVIARDVLQEDK